jgi:tetratricopeptide (TPR) repeat protein
LIFALLAAGPAAAPTDTLTSRQSAEQWLARADVDLAKIVDTRPTDVLFDNAELSVAVFDAGPTDRRRETAARVIRSQAAARAAAADSAELRVADFNTAAGQMAEIGDLDGAAAMLAEAGKPTTLPSKKPNENLGRSDYSRAIALIALGKTDEIGNLPPWPWLVHQSCCKFRDIGRDDLADELLQAARASNRCTGDDLQSMAWVNLADAGYFSQALVAAAVEPPADGHLIYLFGDQVRVARMALRAGDKQVLAKLRDAMLQRLRRHPEDVHTEQELGMVVSLTAEAGDCRGLDQLSDFYTAHPPANSAAEIESMLAVACVDAGNVDTARKHLDRVIAAVHKDYADPNVSARGNFEAGMCLAKTYARLGDVESANRAMTESPNRPDPKSTVALQPYFELESAFAAAGLYDEALKLAKAGDPTDFDWAAEMIACEMAFAGHYLDAVKLALQIRPPGRMPTLYYIAVTQVRRHDTTHPGWLDRVPTAQERVLLDIFVANGILGRRDRFLEDRMRDFGPHRPEPAGLRGY